MSTTSIYQEYQDPKLVELWLAGDEAAFDTLYRRYLIRLLNTAYNKTQQRETARELVQEVFMELYIHRKNLSVKTSLQGYLFTILRNKVYNYYRHKLVQEQYLQATSLQQNHATDPVGKQLERKELQEQIHEKISQLPEQCRKVFLLSREEQLSNKEIAERLQISVNTVEQHIRKARRLLRASLGNYDLSIISVFLISMLETYEF